MDPIMAFYISAGVHTDFPPEPALNFSVLNDNSNKWAFKKSINTDQKCFRDIIIFGRTFLQEDELFLFRAEIERRYEGR